jgi:predicted DNA-binding transcriptional regulator AlpA
VKQPVFPSEADDRLLRATDVCRWLNLSESTLYKWIKDGKFPKPYSLGDEQDQNSVSRFSKKEIEDWLYARPRGKFHGTEKAVARSPRVRKNPQANLGSGDGAGSGDEA